MQKEITELKKQIQNLEEKQQTTNELLLGLYNLVDQYLERGGSISILHDEELVDEFTEKIINNNTSDIVRANYGGLYKTLPECKSCGHTRYMQTFSYDGRTGKSTYWCRICDVETEVSH